MLIIVLLAFIVIFAIGTLIGEIRHIELPFPIYLLGLIVYILFVIAYLMLMILAIPILVIALISKTSKTATEVLPNVAASPNKLMNGFTKLVKCFPKCMNEWGYYSDATKYNICPPKHVYSNGKPPNGRVANQYTNIYELEEKDYKEDNTDTFETNTFTDPNTTRVNKTNKALNVFHSVILFYRRFYGHSTKVEKNLGSF